MKIKCIYKKWSDVPISVVSSNNLIVNESEFYLDLEKEYIVYGMTIRDGCFWYYVCDRLFSYFPRWKPSFFFEVSDPRLSRYWVYSNKKLEDYLKSYPIITFPEWASNHPDFYDKLSDGNEKEVMIFKSYKELMDLEFPDPSISKIAQIGDAEWLICPYCSEAWQYGADLDALVKCPICLNLSNNPRYKNDDPRLESQI